jgi:cellulose synthase/poly-beta-1,6-N-acetylglucosamine synthase-like glycosyltransferase
MGRFARLATDLGSVGEEGAKLHRLLVLIPSRAEGSRVLGLTGDLKREARSQPQIQVDVLVVLDGGDESVEAQLRAEGTNVLVKTPAGPSKGVALAFATAALDRASDLLDRAEYILVFDADMRLPAGWLGKLQDELPAHTDVFQLPVRPAGEPAPGAARVEAFSLAVATRVEDLVRDARRLPVRLRGKAMGFSPQAWRLGPASCTRTLAEDSEASIALLARGFRIRALRGPVAFDEPSGGTSAMASPRARWLAGHWKLAVTGWRDLLRIGVTRPMAGFVLAADLFLRPRLLILAFLLVVAIGSTVALVIGRDGPALLVLLALSWGTLVLELGYLRTARRLIGFPSEVPRVRTLDVVSAAGVWSLAIVRAVVSPSRWHRAREERIGLP